MSKRKIFEEIVIKRETREDLEQAITLYGTIILLLENQGEEELRRIVKVDAETEELIKTAKRIIKKHDLSK